jgi:RNA polymerase sigma-70 factor (ECF subfamily)
LANTDEFNKLVENYAQDVYTHAHRMLGSREEAEEAAQDVFVRIHRSLAGFQGRARISTWIWRITTNVCLTRREVRRKSITVPLDEEAATRVSDESPDPECSFIVREERDRLGRLIASLPDREAAAITLYYIEGMDYKEIAGILDIPAGSVATALHRGREHLAGRLSDMKERP